MIFGGYQPSCNFPYWFIVFLPPRNSNCFFFKFNKMINYCNNNIIVIMKNKQGFLYAWDENPELRNVFIIITSVTAFILTWVSTKFPTLNNNYIIAVLLFFLFVIIWMFLDWLLIDTSIGHNVMVASSFCFIITLIFAIIIQDSNIIVGGSTLILVIITGYNIVKTSEMAEKQRNTQILLSEKQRQSELEPIVLLSLKENDVDVHIIDLIIENVGRGIAKNIKFEVTPHGFTTLSGDPLEKLFFFKHGIQVLPPKQKYFIHMTNLAEKINEIKKRHHIEDPAEWRRKLMDELQLRIKIFYENSEGDPKEGVFIVNLCIFWGLRYPVKQNNIFPSNASTTGQVCGASYDPNNIA